MKLRAASWTPCARAWLSGSSEFRILHLFQDVCNLANGRDQILSLIAAGVDRTAFSIRLDPSPELIDAGGFAGLLNVNAKVVSSRTSLRVGELKVSIVDPEVWDPVPDWRAIRRLGCFSREVRSLLSAILVRDAPPGGLAALANAYSMAEPQSGVEGDALQAARRSADRLASGLRVADSAAIEVGAAELSGLGGGLTPSGDDFLVGCLHALWSALPEEGARELGRPLADAAIARTTALSGAWIEAAARGEAAEHWHAVFNSLIASDRPGFRSAAARLLRVGHSSGADALAGFLVALAALQTTPSSVGGVSS